MVNTENPYDKNTYKKLFIKDVQRQLDKIAEDYICPEEGSADFVLGFIPSEAVYYFLISEAFDVLRDYSKKNVQVVSPLILSSRLELIKAGVHAKKLSEDAEKVMNKLRLLSRHFGGIDNDWRVFYGTHFKNLENKAGELDDKYGKLRDEFNRISDFAEE